MRTPRPILLAFALGASAVTALAATATVMSVQVKKADLRTTPSFLGTITASLQYGDRVDVSQQNGPWFCVTKTGGTAAGWVHSSALTRKTIAMAAGGTAQTGASSGEMALAGKGFNADVEKEFRSTHKDIDFSWVDRMEKYRIEPAVLQSFAKEGALIGKGGGR